MKINFTVSLEDFYGIGYHLILRSKFNQLHFLLRYLNPKRNRLLSLKSILYSEMLIFFSISIKEYIHTLLDESNSFGFLLLILTILRFSLNILDFFGV